MLLTAEQKNQVRVRLEFAFLPEQARELFIERLSDILAVAWIEPGRVPPGEQKKLKAGILRELDSAIRRIENWYREEYGSETDALCQARTAPRWQPIYKIRDTLRRELEAKRSKPDPPKLETRLKISLVEKIAGAYREAFGEEPSNYRLDGEEAGPFYSVIRLVFSFLEIPSRFPDKIIQAALSRRGEK